MEVKSGELEYVANNGEITTALVPYTDISIYKSKAKRKFESIVKRAIDVIGGLVGIIVLIPLTLIIFIANFISGDKGALFYSQERIGKNGKIFKMYKFRSMVVGADEKLQKYLEENEEVNKYIVACKPGVTGFWQVPLFSDNGILQSAKGVA